MSLGRLRARLSRLEARVAAEEARDHDRIEQEAKRKSEADSITKERREVRIEEDPMYPAVLAWEAALAKGEAEAEAARLRRQKEREQRKKMEALGHEWKASEAPD